MRLFIAVIILISNLQSLTKANDIRDFEIEGMSIGDSLLDHFSEDYLDSFEKYYYPKSKKFYYKGRKIKNGNIYIFSDLGRLAFCNLQVR